MDRKGIVKWLEENLDSHGIYLESMLEQLKPLGITYTAKTRTLKTDEGQKAKAPVETEAWFKKSVEDRGLGGWVDLKGERGFSGLDLVETICILWKVEACRAYFGRGRNFDGSLEALRRAADQQA